MKKSRYLALILIVTLLSQIVVFPSYAAQDEAEIAVSRDVASGTFTINGRMSSQMEGVPVTLNVYPEGKNENDLLAVADPESVLVFHGEFYTGQNGIFSIRFKMERKSGIYDGYLYTGDNDKRVKLRLPYVNAEENETALAELNAAKDILACIQTNQNPLGFFMELYQQVNQSSVADIIKHNMPFDVKDAETAITVFEQAVIAQALTENKIDNIQDYREAIPLLTDDSSSLKKWYEGFLSDKELQERITARLAGENYSDIDAFEKALTEAVILEVIRHPNGFGNVQNIITEYADTIGISNPVGSAAVYQNLSGQSFADYAALRNEYQKQINDLNFSAGGSSGSSSAGGGYSVSHDIAAPPPVQVIPEPMYSVEETGNVFTDLDSVAWAIEAIDYLRNKGIVNGKEPGRFCPEDAITREEYATLLVRAFSFPMDAEATPFHDVVAESWYAPYIAAAYHGGIVNGVEKEIFGVGLLISREDMAVMSINALKALDSTVSVRPVSIVFEDRESISDYAVQAVDMLSAADILVGDGKNFRPQDYTTRAEAAKVLYLLLTKSETGNSEEGEK